MLGHPRPQPQGRSWGKAEANQGCSTNTSSGLTPQPLLWPTSTSGLCLNRKTFLVASMAAHSRVPAQAHAPAVRYLVGLNLLVSFFSCVLKYSIKSSDQKSIALRIPGYLLFFFFPVVFHVGFFLFSLFLSTVKPKQKKWRKKKKKKTKQEWRRRGRKGKKSLSELIRN